MNRIITDLLVIMALLISTTCYSKDNSFVNFNNGKTECIGRYLINLPDEIEIATNKLLPNEGVSREAEFGDGKDSQFSKIDYFGDVRVILPASEVFFLSFKNNSIKSKEKQKLKYISSIDEKHRRRGEEMKELTYDTPNLFGWDSEDHWPGLHFFLENKIFSFSFRNINGSDKIINKKYFDFVLNGFRMRPLYDVPKQQGVCIPFGFIADDSTTPRSIAVTMRLLGHPDIEIGFKDSSEREIVYLPGKKPQYEHPDPKYAINDFFGNSGILDSDEKVKGGFLGMHSVEMDGRNGGAISVTITRADGSLDYGYVAAVKGDFTAKSDTPSLFLYVIRTASRAKGKPVSKDELKEMAEKIVASVKRHPIQ